MRMTSDVPPGRSPGRPLPVGVRRLLGEHGRSASGRSGVGGGGTRPTAKESTEGGSWAFSETAAGQALKGAVTGASREELRALFAHTLETRQRKQAIGALAVVLGLGTIVYINRQRAKEAVAVEISDVASRSLGDEKMQAQATLATKQTLQALLGDETTVKRSVEFLSAVAAAPESREALITLLVDALKSRAVLQEALSLTLWVLDDERARTHLCAPPAKPAT